MTSPYYATAISHYDWIASYGRRTPDKLATVDLYSNRRRTYREFDNRIGRAALALRHGFGIGRGDRVAVLAPNCMDFFELQFACGRLGAIMLPLNWRLTVPELAYILGDATPKLLIHDKRFAQQATALSKHPACEIDARRRAATAPTSARSPRRAAVPPPMPLTHDDIGMSCTRRAPPGHPKGAIITHGMVFWNCVNLGIPAMISPRDRAARESCRCSIPAGSTATPTRCCMPAARS